MAMNMDRTHIRAGFSLIETVLYLAIVSFVTIVLMQAGKELTGGLVMNRSGGLGEIIEGNADGL